jgi:hypothetical protein
MLIITADRISDQHNGNLSGIQPSSRYNKSARKLNHRARILIWTKESLAIPVVFFFGPCVLHYLFLNVDAHTSSSSSAAATPYKPSQACAVLRGVESAQLFYGRTTFLLQTGMYSHTIFGIRASCVLNKYEHRAFLRNTSIVRS